MRQHVANAAYGVLDYVSYPVGMLLVAHVVLRRLGASEYGLWMISAAIVSAGSIIASGFCDANLQRVAALRGHGNLSDITSTVRTMLGINLVAGAFILCITWTAAPYASAHIPASGAISTMERAACFRIVGIVILGRAIETVAVSTHRAFQHYRATVQISVIGRLATLSLAAALATAGGRTTSILVATALIQFLCTLFQFRELRTHLGAVPLWPAYHPQIAKNMLNLGLFSWLQAIGNVAFAQFDRIILGFTLGTAAVAPYSLCIQCAQPVLGITGSALHFLFPYFARQAGTHSRSALRKNVLKAFALNVLLVSIGAGLLLAFGGRFLSLWAGPAVGATATQILPLIVLGSAMIGISVTGIYAMQAFGRFRDVALVHLAGKAVSLILMLVLLHHLGLQGLAIARVCFGVFSLWLYVPLFLHLRDGHRKSKTLLPAAPCRVQEGTR